MLLGEAKSINLSTGAEVGWKRSQPRLDIPDPKKALDSIVDACAGLIGALFQVLHCARVGRSSVRLASDYLKVSVALDKTGITRALKEGRLTVANLEDHEIAYREGEDKFFVKP